MQDRPQAGGWGCNDSSQTGMGVHERAALARDEEVMLEWSGHCQQHIARLYRVAHARKPRTPGEDKPVVDLAIAQAVANREYRLLPDIPQRPFDQSDAIQACGWVAPVQAEGRADVALCGERKADARIAHEDEMG